MLTSGFGAWATGVWTDDQTMVKCIIDGSRVHSCYYAHESLMGKHLSSILLLLRGVSFQF
jgi:hypothetical protein